MGRGRIPVEHRSLWYGTCILTFNVEQEARIIFLVPHSLVATVMSAVALSVVVRFSPEEPDLRFANAREYRS